MGFGVAFTGPLGLAAGLALGCGATSGTACSTDWYTPSRDSQTSFAGAPSPPGTMYIPRRSDQPCAPPTRRYWARYVPSVLSSAMTRLFPRS